MLMAMAMGMRTMVLVSNRPQLKPMVCVPPLPHMPTPRRAEIPPRLACHVHPVRRQPSEKFDEPVEEGHDVRALRHIEVRGPTGELPAVRDGHPGRDLATGLDVDEERVRFDQAPIQGG